jgi:hypothetical protein
VIRAWAGLGTLFFNAVVPQKRGFATLVKYAIFERCRSVASRGAVRYGRWVNRGAADRIRYAFIAAYRPAVCRHGGRRGRGRRVERPEAGRDARRRDLGDGLDHACRRRHCSR